MKTGISLSLFVSLALIAASSAARADDKFKLEFGSVSRTESESSTSLFRNGKSKTVSEDRVVGTISPSGLKVTRTETRDTVDEAKLTKHLGVFIEGGTEKTTVLDATVSDTQGAADKSAGTQSDRKPILTTQHNAHLVGGISFSF
jgi:hypothetical protein